MQYSGFKNIGYNHSGSPAIYSYATTDTIALVIASGYFSDPRAEIVAGDVIHCYASDGYAQLVASDTQTAEFTPARVAGWATYIDTQYPNSGSAFTISANTDTVFPNNAGSVINSQMPKDISDFYSGGKVTGRNGDNLDIMIYCKAVPSAANQWCDVWIDIGGSVGEIYRQTFAFPKGAGVERGLMYSLPSAYTLGTWESNGGTVYIRSSASLDIYQINFNLDRSHKAV